MNYLENEFFLLAITFGIYFFAKLLQKKTGFLLLNPILLTIAVLIIFLKITHISYETYNEGGHLIEFWLKPAVVARTPVFAVGNDQKTIATHIIITVGRLFCRSCFRCTDSQTNGSFTRSYSLSGSEIRNHSYCHGSNQKLGRYSFADSSSSSLCRITGGYTRIQNNETDACR